MKTHKWALPFGPTVIPPRETKILTVQPGTLYRADGIVNTGDEEDLFVMDILVDGESQNPSNTPLGGWPASAFKESVFAGNMQYDCAQRTFAISVRNGGMLPRTFQATVCGNCLIYEA